MSAEELKVMEETPKANEDLPEFNHEINEVVYTKTVVATFFSCTRSNITWH